MKTTKQTAQKQKLSGLHRKNWINYIQKLEKNAIQILSNSVIIEKNATEVSVHGTLDAMVTVSRRTEIENTKTQEGTDKYGIDTTVVGHSD